MIIYRIIYQLVMLLLRFLNGVHPKLKKGYELRQKVDGVYPWLRFPQNTQPIWFHCASGEFEYALPLIRKIKEQTPEQKILVTYFTPSYLPRLSKEPLVDYLCPSPWDTPKILREFIAHHNPKALLFARTDVWAEMAKQAYAAKIPTIIFSMTFNKTLGVFDAFFQSWRLTFIDFFFVVAEDDKNKLARIFPAERIFVAGDTRYEQCLFRLAEADQNREAKKLNVKVDLSLLSKPVFVAGSLWNEDETVLLELIKNNREKCHWIMVPHEVHEEHLLNLSERINAIGEHSVLSDCIHTWTGKGVLIVNEFGLLAHLYRLAPFAFVGGSFKKNVHSVMEPLATGCLTFVGPHYHNNREAEEFSQMKEGFSLAPVQVVASESFNAQFIAGLGKWSSSDALKLREVFAAKACATEKILSHLKL